MPRTERLWVAGAVVVALLMALVGYFLLIGPERARTGAVRHDVSTAAFQETTLQSRIASLTAQNKQIATYRAALARARQALPASGDRTATPRLLRDLAAEAAATSTSITDLSVGDPVLVAATPSGTAAPTASAPTVSDIAIGLTVLGSAANLNTFLTDLQAAQPRALLVSAATLAYGADGAAGLPSLKLTMNAFVRPPGS